MNIKSLDVGDVCRRCDPKRFSFSSTEELTDLETPIGQQRALEALEFGIGIRKEGYNLFLLGPTGSGKYTVARAYLENTAANQATPSDWVYVSNFEHSHKPRALELPTGQAVELQHDMDRLVEDLHSAIPAAFEAEEYQVRVNEIESEFEERRQNTFQELTKEAEKFGIRLLRTPGGFAFAPVVNDEVLKPEDYEKLPKNERQKIDERISVLEEQLANILRQIPKWQREAREKLKELEREVAKFSVEALIDELKKKYADHNELQIYFDQVKEDIIVNAAHFRRAEEGSAPLEQISAYNGFQNRYKVNVFVDHSKTRGAPVIYEDNPTIQNMLGRVEHRSQMGTLFTDFTLIKPGAIHQANGGYLILDVRKLLQQAFSYDGLKRALKSHEIRIQSLAEMYSLISTISLEPQAIPLRIKVVLIGERQLYYLLNAYDPDFGELFKVAADFEDQVNRSEENDMLYARMVATLARKEKIKPLDASAVALIIEQASRFISDAEKISTHLLSIVDLMREADYYAQKHNHPHIERNDVQAAIDGQIKRADRIQQRIYEEIQRGTILIDTEGEKMSQVNGLSVLDLGHYSFGQPSRITATARLGEGEVIDIEREVELGGAIHSKGVMIITSFLAARYAKNRPLSLSASLVFEQSYAMVDGDSASLAELCALISALTEIPIKQNLAITGSVNQLGEAQPIGGVNEKIEGFFAVCHARELTGDQGVIIPKSNVKHLMLKQHVVDAIEDEKFHIYSINNIDEAMELLMGRPAGVPDEKGDYPDGTVNAAVSQRICELIEMQKRFGKQDAEKSTIGISNVEDKNRHE